MNGHAVYAHNKAVLLNYKLILDFVTHRIGKKRNQEPIDIALQTSGDTVHIHSFVNFFVFFFVQNEGLAVKRTKKNWIIILMIIIIII
jgi:hypothetical protein